LENLKSFTLNFNVLTDLEALNDEQLIDFYSYIIHCVLKFEKLKCFQMWSCFTKLDKILEEVILRHSSI
jgi:hypothetical protein